MFGIDDFAVWFAWYFVTDLAAHPSAQRAIEKAQAAMIAPPPTVEAEEPHRLLDWLTTSPDGGGQQSGTGAIVPETIKDKLPP